MNPILNLLIGPVLQLVEKYLPDPQAKANMQLELLKLQASEEFKQLDAMVAMANSQNDINKQEAASGSVFVAGARPFILWVCAAALASQYILRPFVQWGFSIAHQPIPVLPGIDDNLWQLMAGMLGLGALRSFDKSKGSATMALK